MINDKGVAMRTLVVDDDYVSRVKLKSLLLKYGDCDAVANGKMAIEMISLAHAEKVPYDLVTMDIEMPGMKGQEVIKQIRDFSGQLVAVKKLKILVVTVKTDLHNVSTSYYEGSDGYLVKPTTPVNLEDQLKKIGLIS